ncbi:acyl carrier protein [Novosphingobium aquae]|uniref:Acyl carrier protein n=1 Tax=Novosphingobium aquae TaxID=3133435 RepID=A0ABU8S4A7_9SPHN
MTPSQDIIVQVIGRAQQCGCPKAGAIEPHSVLAGDLGWTPIDLHFLAFDLEEGFGIEFATDEELSWRTVADICRAIEARLNPKTAVAA